MKRAIAIAIVFAACASAQIAVQFIPEGTGIVLDVVPKAHGLSYWQINLCNNGATARTLWYQQLAMMPGAPQLISPQSALIVLNAAVQKSGWAKAAKIGKDVLLFGAMGVGFSGLAGQISMRAATIIATSATAITTLGPQVVSDFQSLQPSPAALLNQLSYPLTIAPAACTTDYEFTARINRKKGGTVPAAVLVTIP